MLQLTVSCRLGMKFFKSEAFINVIMNTYSKPLYTTIMNIYSQLKEVKNKMPNRDGTGPMGQGPMTGRGMGPCGAGQARGFGGGRGFGRGQGRGFGRVIPVYQEPTKEQEAEILKAEKTEIERELKEIEKRLKELK